MISTLLLTREFSVVAGEGSDLRFRVEIFRMDEADLGTPSFCARVWRNESVRLFVLGSADENELYDHTCLVADDLFDGLQIDAQSADEAFHLCRTKILSQCGRGEV
jgi:hypothetical protein